MSEKEYILEVRAMTWDESCKYWDKRDELAKEYKDNVAALGRKLIGFLIDTVYPDVKGKLTPAEMMKVHNRTIELSDVVREDEIKNLKPSSDGSTNEQLIAETAEK